VAVVESLTAHVGCCNAGSCGQVKRDSVFWGTARQDEADPRSAVVVFSSAHPAAPATKTIATAAATNRFCNWPTCDPPDMSVTGS